MFFSSGATARTCTPSFRSSQAHFVHVQRARAIVHMLAQGFDLFAYPTSGESVGWVILEAMAAGKAIVSTAVGSVPTLVTHAFNGFLTQSTEAIELVEYVLTLMDSDDIRISMGVRSRERAIRDFSWDGFVQAYRSM
jgi:glycosyltransferase involved in cell wall biosynthesis